VHLFSLVASRSADSLFDTRNEHNEKSNGHTRRYHRATFGSVRMMSQHRTRSLSIVNTIGYDLRITFCQELPADSSIVDRTSMFIGISTIAAELFATCTRICHNAHDFLAVRTMNFVRTATCRCSNWNRCRQVVDERHRRYDAGLVHVRVVTSSCSLSLSFVLSCRLVSFVDVTSSTESIEITIAERAAIVLTRAKSNIIC
jgi:hypothetical protein